MAVPWLRLIDAFIGVGDVVRRVKARGADDEPRQGAVGPSALGGIEARLAGVVVAALKEAFDRDHQRLELERQQLEAERQRAERALRLEMLRQAGDREIGRMRLVAGVALAGWAGTLLLASRLLADTGGRGGARNGRGGAVGAPRRAVAGKDGGAAGPRPARRPPPGG